MSEIAKKEKARRVWRLNKKEGIPVLEALETVDISKDVYYRIKDDWEEKWEEEILTVEQIQKRLAEVDEKLEKREKKLQQLESRVHDARKVAGDVEGALAFEHGLRSLREDFDGIEDRLEHIEAEADIDQTSGPTLEDVVEAVRKLEKQDLNSRLAQVEKEVNQVRNRAEKNTTKIAAVEEEIPQSIRELL